MTARDRPGAGMSAAELGREFDLSFSRAAELERPAEEKLLVLGLGSRRFAVRSRDVRAIVRTPRIARVPSPLPALLGIAGVRGEILAVFDLAKLLGVGDDEQGLRWSLLAGDAERAALAFPHFERFERVPSAAVARADAGELRVAFVEEVVRLNGEVLPIVGVERLLAGLQTST